MNISLDKTIIKLHKYIVNKPLLFKLIKSMLSGTDIHKRVQTTVHKSRQLSDSLIAIPQNVQASVNSDNNEEFSTGNFGHWDHHVQLVESKVIKGWLDWEFIETEYIRPNLSGDKSVYYLQHFFNEHLPKLPVTNALSLGCGGGNLERALIQLNAVESIDAFDASQESIRLAIDLSKKEGISNRISYFVSDINNIKIKENSYDFIVAKMSLHHFERFDHIFKEIAGGLKPGGVFMFNEYVGPSRFQWTDEQLKFTNKILATLPSSYRHSIVTGNILEEIHRPTIVEMIQMDPSEAVNSEQIIPVLSKYFDVLEHKKYGGTIIHLLLNHIMDNFDTSKESDCALLRMIFLYEQTLIENNILPSDFCYIVAKPKLFNN